MKNNKLEILEGSMTREGVVEKEKSPRRVFVEVGTSEVPVPRLGTKKFSDGDIYIGVDVKKSSVRRAKEVIRENKNIYFLQADAEQLPVGDSSTDELYFGNVFGDPSISVDEKRKFLKEAERVLKDGGRLVIKETNTPLAVDDLRELLEGRNLEQEKFLTPKDKNWNEEVKLYHKEAVDTEPWWQMYLAIFRKKEQK